jgi:AraC-type transcriptional regulator N-terminus
LCIVAQGQKAVTVDGATYGYDPFHYLVLNSHLHFQAEILEATPATPFLSFVLQIDPSVVRQVSSDMLERRTTAFRQHTVRQHAVEDEPPDQSAFVSALDQELAGAVLPFLRSIDTGADRRVLAPMYLGNGVPGAAARAEAKPAALDPLKGAVHERPRDGVAEQEEVQVGRGRCLGHLQFIHADGMDHEEVAVRAVAWRRRRPDVPSVAGVISECHRVARQIPAVARGGRKVGHGGGDVGHRPVPEARGSRDVGVKHRHREAPRLIGKARPAKLR